MSTPTRIYSALVTALPALVTWRLFVSTTGENYFGRTYLIVCYVFLAVSLVLGLFIPSIFPVWWKRHPALWLFGQELLAWLGAIVALVLLNLTPLCLGAENGDGINGFPECMGQSVMVPLVYSPVEFTLLCLTALPGGWFIKRLIKSEAT